MQSRLRPSPAMVVALIALFVALGGTAAALSGSNTVFTDDITDNQVYSADVRNDTLSGGGLAAADLKPSSVGTSEVANNSIASADITNGAVSILDTNKVIPSGATVTGLLGEFEHGGGAVPLQDYVDFHGLRAPADLTDADVTFDNVGISADAAELSEENANCTGGIFTPTAPSGKVCIYLFLETVDNGTAFGDRLGWSTGFTEADRYGFSVGASSSVSPAELRGTWAYTAP